jgi:hypothetical protein
VRVCGRKNVLAIGSTGVVLHYLFSHLILSHVLENLSSSLSRHLTFTSLLSR